MQQDAAYAKEAEGQARQWIEQITGEKIDQDFFAGLKDGSHLCRSMKTRLCICARLDFFLSTNTDYWIDFDQALWHPNTRHLTHSPLNRYGIDVCICTVEMYSLCVQLETIGKFLDGCKAYGVSESDLFVTLDLHEMCNKNMVWVG